MNIYNFSMYVNQDVDDTFSTEEIARWFNKAIANYNLIPPVTTYPYINMDNELTTDTDEYNTAISDTDDSDGFIGAYTEYPLKTTFMLAVMLPYVSSAVKLQEASMQEKQLLLQEFITNAMIFKSTNNVEAKYMLDQNNPELEMYKLGEGAYLTDFTTSPMAGDWSTASSYKEVRFVTKDDTLYKVIDDSKVDEDWDTIIAEQEG